jgi:regulator of protease activity HflC (stomatin/prohibitin superfamily)
VKASPDEKDGKSYLQFNNANVLDVQVNNELSVIEWLVVILIGAFYVMIPIFWPWCIRILAQHERCVHLRMGKLQAKQKGPGLFFFIPYVDEVFVVDLRVQMIDIPPQEMITKDSVTAKVNAVVYFFVADACKATTVIDNYSTATKLLGATSLRSIVGESELDELIMKRDVLKQRLSKVLDAETDRWGVKVVGVEIQDVALPNTMQRSMASQAEAERDRRAQVISAEGELQAAQALTQAAANLHRNPATIQLRYLQTLNTISIEQSETIVFPLPVEMLQGMGTRRRITQQ